jgi:hypothetical protein
MGLTEKVRRSLRRRGLQIAAFGSALLLFSACLQSDYTKMVKTEMAKGIRYDSVLLGINFGDSNHDFSGRCFDLNKEGLITQGIGVSVRYVLSDSVDSKLKAPLEIDFYPTFDEKSRIAEMRLKFAYIGWTGWNKALHADSLQRDVMSLMKRWYGGNEFVYAELDTVNVPVKVDGNRRIIISKLDAVQVEAQIQDLMNPMFKPSIFRNEDEKKQQRSNN